jgi:Immunity protein Imm5
MFQSLRLENLLEAALRFVENHPVHDLNLGYRQAIWAAFGLPLKLESNHNIGYLKRIKLALITARKVLPIWDAKFPKYKLPHEALKITEGSLIGKYNFKATEKYLHQAWTAIENLASEPEFQDDDTQRAIAAGTSAVRTVSTVLYDEKFDYNNICYENLDEDLDSFLVDTSFWAAISYAGPTWQPNVSEHKKRLEFWIWWLKEAVPIAWKEGQNSGVRNEQGDSSRFDR